MAVFSELPTEIIEMIVEYCPAKSIEGLAACCRLLRTLCAQQLEEHRSRMQDNFRWLHLTTGLTEDYRDGEEIENFLRNVWTRPDEIIFHQKLFLTQGSGFVEGHDYPHTYKKDSLTYFEEGRSISADHFEENLPTLLEQLRLSYDEYEVEKLNPVTRRGDYKTWLSVRQATVSLALAHLSYVRCLCITTTNRGDDGFTLKLLRLASKSNPLSQRRPLFGLFHHLVKLTIVSKSHIAQTRTYPKGGPYLKAWGLPDHETAEEWSLISQAMKLPNLQVLQACGLRVLEPERYSKEMTVAPNLRTILIKRSHLSWGCLDDLIQASPRVKHFSYDYAPSNHVWRLQYKHPRPPIDDEADAGIVYEWPFWRESKAARNLEILDLSFEMAEFKKPHRSSKEQILVNLMHVSCDHSIPLDMFKQQRARERISKIVFEVIDRTSRQKHISPQWEQMLNDIWSYPDVNTTKSVEGRMPSTPDSRRVERGDKDGAERGPPWGRGRWMMRGWRGRY